MESGASRFCSWTSSVPNSTRLAVTPRMRAVFSARSIWRDIQKIRSATLESISRGPRLSVHDPCVFRAAALRGIDHQRALAQGHARETPWNEIGLLAGKYVRAQVDVAGRQAVLHESWTGGKRKRRLGNVVRGICADARAKGFDLAFLRRRAYQHSVAAGALHLLNHQLADFVQNQLQVLRLLAEPGGHVLQDRLF